MNLRPPRLKHLISGAFFLVLCNLSFPPARGHSDETIAYKVSLPKPERHLFHVSIKLPVKGEALLQMPAWNALYQIKDFASRIQGVQAHAESGAATIEKIDKQTWRVTGNGTVQIDYSIYWDEVGPFATQLNGEHAFINPAEILMYVVGRTSEKASLAIGEFPENWRLASATAFHCESQASHPQCTSEVSTYNQLADGPIEVGKFQQFDLQGVSPPVTVVVHGDKENWKKKQVEDELKRICQYETKLMEGAPYEHYTFILHIGKGAGGGGMEHSNSTAIGTMSDDYLPNVAAHEFFHLWNVKRIRPASLEPVDYTKEQYTRALWFAEGVTSTYGDYTLVRTGLWSKERFYEGLGYQITELEERPANRWQSAEQSSLDAWLEKYPLYNQADYSVSYYTKGQVLGELLDILIRDRTNNAKSLDDVLRAMNIDFAKQGKFYRDSLDVRLTAEKVAGGSFQDFFQKYVAGVEPFPYQQIFKLAGIEVRTVERRQPNLGLSLARDAYGTLVAGTIDADGPAGQAGLRVGDAIVTWNGGEAPRRLGRWLSEQKPGDLVKLRIKREEQELALEFRIGETKETAYEVAEDPQANEKALNIREGLLRGETGSVSRR